MEDTHKLSITEIKKDLISDLDLETVMQKHLIDRRSYFFGNVLKNPDIEYEIRLDISKILNVSINDVIIVGSAKLGFSPKTKEFIKFDEGKNKRTGKPQLSDIDIAIISRDIFDKLTYQIYQISNNFHRPWISRNWAGNRYYNNFDEEDCQLHRSYSEYIAKGWFRPDFLPEIFLANWDVFKLVEQWKNRLGNRKISVCVYSSWIFFKHYQINGLKNLKTGLKTGEDI